MDIFDLLIKIVICAAWLVVLFMIGKDIVRNIVDILKTNKLQLEGLSVSANVVNVEAYKQTVKGSKQALSIIKYVTMQYQIDRNTYTKVAELRDSTDDIQIGSVIELRYDRAKPDKAVMKYGEESKSAKKNLGWDLMYLILAAVFWLYMFLQIETK